MLRNSSTQPYLFVVLSEQVRVRDRTEIAQHILPDPIFLRLAWFGFIECRGLMSLYVDRFEKICEFVCWLVSSYADGCEKKNTWHVELLRNYNNDIYLWQNLEAEMMRGNESGCDEV